MKRLLMIILVLTLILPMGITRAQEPDTKEDNACNEGGSMAGKCDIPWEWVCGYYLARWESAGGWNTPGNVINDACISLLPPQPVAEAPLATVGRCVTVGIMTICLYSGFLTISNPPIESIIIPVSGPIPASCPLTYGGKTYISSGSAVILVIGLSGYFTPDEIATAGFTANACQYT